RDGGEAPVPLPLHAGREGVRGDLAGVHARSLLQRHAGESQRPTAGRPHRAPGRLLRLPQVTRCRRRGHTEQDEVPRQTPTVDPHASALNLTAPPRLRVGLGPSPTFERGKTMEDRMKINDDVTVGPQPTEDQLAELARTGFRTVVNLRTVGE